MRTRSSTDKIASGEKFDPIQYVNENYDNYEDRWGINLMNLEEVTSQEMTDENMKEILLKLVWEAQNKKKKIMTIKMENRKRLMQTMKKKKNKKK